MRQRYRFVLAMFALCFVAGEAHAQQREKKPPRVFVEVADWFYEGILRDVQGSDRERQLVAKALYYNCREAKTAAEDVTAATKAGIENVLEFGEQVLRLTLNKDYLQRANHYYSIASDAHDKTEYAEAIDCYMRAIYYNGEMWRAYDRLSDIFLEPVSGFYSPKRAFLMSRLGLLVQPREPSLHHSYVRSLLHLQQYSQALNAADRAMAISTWESAGWDHFRSDRGRCKLIARKAQALWALKEADKARRYFIMAQKIDSRSEVAWVKSFIDGTRDIGQLGFGVSEEIPGTGNLRVTSKPWQKCMVSFLGETQEKTGESVFFGSIPAGRFILEGWHADARISEIVEVPKDGTTDICLNFSSMIAVDTKRDAAQRAEVYATGIASARRLLAQGDEKKAAQALLPALMAKPGDPTAISLWPKAEPVPPVAFAGRDATLVEKLDGGFQNKDGLGFQWDIGSSGAVGDGTNDAYDGAMRVFVGGTATPSGEVLYSADGNELWIEPVDVKGIRVSRRILISREHSFCRWLTILHRPAGSDPIELEVTVHSDLGNSPSQISAIPGGEKIVEDGTRTLVTNDGDNSRPAIAHFICGEHARSRPKVSLSGDNIYYRYSLSLRGGQTVALMHVEAQRATFAEATKATKKLNPQLFFGDLDQHSAKLLLNW